MKLIERTDEYVREHPIFVVGWFFLTLAWYGLRSGNWLLLTAVGLPGLLVAAQFLLESVNRAGDD